MSDLQNWSPFNLQSFSCHLETPYGQDQISDIGAIDQVNSKAILYFKTQNKNTQISSPKDHKIKGQKFSKTSVIRKYKKKNKRFHWCPQKHHLYITFLLDLLISKPYLKLSWKQVKSDHFYPIVEKKMEISKSIIKSYDQRLKSIYGETMDLEEYICQEAKKISQENTEIALKLRFLQNLSKQDSNHMKLIKNKLNIFQINNLRVNNLLNKVQNN